MSFVSNGGKFKLYTVPNCLFFQRLLSPGFHLDALYFFTSTYYPFTKLLHCQSVCKLPHCRSETSNFYFNVGAKMRNFKFEVKFNKFGFLHSKYYLHEVAAQEEDMKCKRMLLTAREKQGIVNYCLERGEFTPLI
jgi:hypothetical protein